MPFLPFNSEVNYRQLKDVVKVAFPEVPFTPVKITYDASTGLIWSGDQQCARKAVGAGISFLYASCCVSDKSFPLLGLNTGDLSLSFLFFFTPLLSYIFHSPEAHWWTRLEFSWHKIFWFWDEGFLPIICARMHVCAWICLGMCLRVWKMKQAIRRLSLCRPLSGVATTDCGDRLIYNLSIFTGSAIWAGCRSHPHEDVSAGVVISSPSPASSCFPDQLMSCSSPASTRLKLPPMFH